MWIFDAICVLEFISKTQKSPDLIGAWRACCNGATLGRESFESVAETRAAKPKRPVCRAKGRAFRVAILSSNQNHCGGLLLAAALVAYALSQGLIWSVFIGGMLGLAAWAELRAAQWERQRGGDSSDTMSNA